VEPYQQAMRAGLNGELTNHYAARLSAANLARLAHIKPGRTGGTCRGSYCPPVCSERCARTTPAATAG